MQLPNLKIFEKVAPFITRILGLNPGPATLQGTNSYLIGYENSKRILVDTTSPGEVAENYFQTLLDRVPAKDLQLECILLTHRHNDHVGCVEKITKHFGIDAYKIQSDREVNTSHKKLLDGDKFILEDLTLETVHTPGHTEDHASFYLYKDNELSHVICGDNILGHGSTTVPHIFNYLESLSKYKRLENLDNLIFLPGHGEIIRDPRSKLDEYWDNRMSRIKMCKKILTEDGFTNETILLAKAYPGLNGILANMALANLRQAMYYLAVRENLLKLPRDMENKEAVEFEYFAKNQEDFPINRLHWELI